MGPSCCYSRYIRAACLPPAARAPEGKVDAILKHCVYEIATGAWPPGARLPSLREARLSFRVNHLTVLRAYRRMVGLGLVRNVPRSGFFVADDPRVGRLAKHRAGLGAEYERLRERLVREGLSVVGALRYLGQLAEARAREQPECAFVECTRFQAEGHAGEVERRLGIPCLPLTTAGIAEEGVPRHVQMLLTTGFHRHEVRRFARPPATVVMDVPIELSPDLAERLPRLRRPVVILATDAEIARHAARDARRALGRRAPGLRAGGCPVDAAAERAGSLVSSGHAVVLSPSLWSALPARGREDPRLFPLEYRVREASWPRIADAAGLPLGSLG